MSTVQNGKLWKGPDRKPLQDSVHPSEDSLPRTTKTTTVTKRRWLRFWTLSTTVETTQTSTTRIGHRYELEREKKRVHRRTTLRDGRVTEDSLWELVVVQDHLGRLHSARLSTYSHGQLQTEAAALYIPTGLAGKAVSGTVAAAMCVGAAGAAAVAGALSGNGSTGLFGGSATGAAATSSGAAVAVGYARRDGEVCWGVVRDVTAWGLPQQRAVTTEALERVRPPPWQAR